LDRADPSTNWPCSNILPVSSGYPLYGDDKQVHALSVTCHHGERAPKILAVAASIGNLIEDLELATQSVQRRWYDAADNRREGAENRDRAIKHINELKDNEGDYRRRFGDTAFELMLRYDHQCAQKYLLGRAALTPLDLAYMYNVPGRGAYGSDLLSGMWERIFASTPLRISLTKLPQADGSSRLWRGTRPRSGTAGQ